SIAAARALDGGGEGLGEGSGIAAVDGDAGHGVAGSALGEVLEHGILAGGRVLRPSVVMAGEDDRQLPQGSKEHGLVDGANAGGTVAEADSDDLAGLLELAGKREADADGGAGADEPGGHHETQVLAGDAHAAALALADALGVTDALAEELLHG